MTIKIGVHLHLRNRTGKWTALEINQEKHLLKVRRTSGARFVRVI